MLEFHLRHASVAVLLQLADRDELLHARAAREADVSERSWVLIIVLLQFFHSMP